jgi:hypothetical protein
MRKYKKLEKRPEFKEIKAIRERLEFRDFIENNPNYKPIYHYDSSRNLINRETGFIKKTYYFDIFYAFDLLNWIRNKKI